MFRRSRWAKVFRLAVVIPLLVSLAAPLLPVLTKDSSATTFKIKTGYYIGTGASGNSISGLGFQPQYIIIKSASNSSAVFKSSAMAGSTAMPLSAATSTSGVTIDSDGFTLSGTSSSINSAPTYFYYTAIAGSDCSASGYVCIGSYSGNGGASQTIATGFQPSMVLNKSSQAVLGHFRTASMPSGNTEFLSSTATATGGGYIDALNSTNFTVGATDNASGATYYYMAMKADPLTLSEGTYNGTGADNRDIAASSFTPNMVVVKNSSSATTNNRRPVWSSPNYYGDLGNYLGDSVGVSNDMIQSLSGTGFQVGTAANVNESGSTLYWFAIGGTQASPTTSGTYSMSVGNYVGNGTSQSITGLTFQPDLVIVKSNSADAGIFKTSDIPGNSSTQIGGAISDFTGAITSLNADGFSVGTATTANTMGTTYHWQAFGGAYNARTNTGAADFAVGSYVGNGVDNRDIKILPFAPDYVNIKRSGASSGIFRTTAHVGDSSSLFSATSDTADAIQTMNSDGWQVGTIANANAAYGIYRWFAFKSSPSFSVGSYVGNAVADREIASPGFQPDLVWIRSASAQFPVTRPSSLPGDASQYTGSLANTSGKIKSLTSSGFTIGGGTEVNTASTTYRYAAWRVPPSGSLGVNVVDSGGSTVASPSFTMNTSGFQFDCLPSSGSLGSNDQRIRVTNTTGSPAWSLTIAATAGASSLWSNGGNTQRYDFNDTTTSGCADGGDADSVAGKMTIDASAGTLSPEGGCSSSDISKGSSSDFDQGVMDSITILSASSSAQTGCYWELTGATLGQTIPAQQASDSYTVNLTVTVTAS